MLSNFVTLFQHLTFKGLLILALKVGGTALSHSHSDALQTNINVTEDCNIVVDISGSGWPYKDLNGHNIFGNVYAFDTTNIVGAPSRCGVTDFGKLWCGH